MVAAVAAAVVVAAAPRAAKIALRSRYCRYTKRRHPLQRARPRLGVVLLHACPRAVPMLAVAVNVTGARVEELGTCERLPQRSWARKVN